MRLARAIVLAALLAGCSATPEGPVATAPDATTTTPAPVVTVTVIETVTPSPDPTPTAETVSPDVPIYVAPDPATVAQFVKGVFRERLDREPDQEELDWHIEWFVAEDREGGDTRARWMEMFEREYAGEMDFIRDQERARETQEFFDDMSRTMSCAASPDQARCQD